MAYTKKRFRTKLVTLTDTVNGVLITPTSFSAEFFPAESFKIRKATIIGLTTGTKVWIRGEVDTDGWVDITGAVKDNTGFPIDLEFVQSFYLKSDNGAATVGIVAYISGSVVM